MYFTNNPNVVEGEAIASMHRFNLVTINGEQYIELTLKLDANVRHYAEGEAPTYFAVSDGINARLLSNVGMPAVEAPVPTEQPATPPPAGFWTNIITKGDGGEAPEAHLPALATPDGEHVWTSQDVQAELDAATAAPEAPVEAPEAPVEAPAPVAAPEAPVEAPAAPEAQE